MSPIQLSSAVTCDHPSSVTVNLSHDSSSGGTLGCVFKSNVSTIFYSSVLHSYMSDHLSYSSSVECGSSAYTTPSSHCPIRYALRSDITWEEWFLGFLQAYFPPPRVYSIHSSWQLFVPIVHGRKDEGCCSMCVP